MRDLIRAVWGPDYSDGTVRELLAVEEAKSTDLGTWLADEFFDGHCRLFHQTPFIWHISDGARGGFSALVNSHRLCEATGAGRRLLEKLRDSYLGEWIGAQRRALAAGEAGADARLIAAEHLRGELTKIIEGDPPYDIFVRWKPLDRQPIGWEPDIDDGVRLNIRPFLTAKPKDSGRRDGCILRVTPRVKKHAGADRGGEPKREKENFPWFWAEDDDVAIRDFGGGPEFKGRRHNVTFTIRASSSYAPAPRRAIPARVKPRDRSHARRRAGPRVTGCFRYLRGRPGMAGRLLWPDPERQWFSAFADLRRRLAARAVALLTYGAYAPDDGIGPAIWLRCLVEAPRDLAFPRGPLKGLPEASALTVILLPGVLLARPSRTDDARARLTSAGRDAIPRRRVPPTSAGARLDGRDVSARPRLGAWP